MYLKPSRIKRAKNGVTCSKECTYKLKSEYTRGEKNHQFGLTGNKNASFAGKEIITNYGYILEYCPNHPNPHGCTNKTTRVLQHRLVIETNYQNFPLDYFNIINGKHYLKMELEVHHIDENKTNNSLDNLQVLTKSEHVKLHNKDKEIIRDDLGKIIGVNKFRELSGTLEAENQQPSLDRDI